MRTNAVFSALSPLLLLAFLSGCGSKTSETGESGLPDDTGDTADTADTATPGDTADTADTADTGAPGPIDADGDGYDASVDCDDENAAINPGAVELCDGFDNNCDEVVDPDDSWWDESFPYRVPVSIHLPKNEVTATPVAIDVDFRVALDALGEERAFEADGLRVVLQDCALGLPEMPSQFLDGWAALFEKQVSHQEPLGDEAGVVVFLYDEDSDLSTLESAPSGGVVHASLYVGFDKTPPSYSTAVATTSDSITSGTTSASFDASRGGLLSSLSINGSDTLASQADAEFGNGPYLGNWNALPASDSGTVTVLESGPIFASIEASGGRANEAGAYDYSYVYWVFAGRPELWSKTHEITTEDATIDHAMDFTNGIRPWEARHDNLVGGTTRTGTGMGAPWADVTLGELGISFGFVRAPSYLTMQAWDAETTGRLYHVVAANDYAPFGLGTPVVIPAETSFIDHCVQFLLPHVTDFEGVQDQLFGLMAGVDTTMANAEGLP